MVIQCFDTYLPTYLPTTYIKELKLNLDKACRKQFKVPKDGTADTKLGTIPQPSMIPPLCC